MKKTTLFTAGVMVIALILVMNSPVVADVIQPMKPQLKQNLQSLSKLMLSISNELSSGKMSMEASQAAASIMKQLSQVLQELSEGNRKYDVHKEGVDQMKKIWQPFTKEALTSD